MADIAIFRINYKSDFILTLQSDAGWLTPFCIKFWTGMPSQAYFAGFDGENYVNCRVGETPTQLLVMFDDHHMPIGELKMQIAYHTTIEEFPDRKFDEVTNPTNVTVDIDGTEYQVMLDFTGETGAEIDFSMPSSGVMSVNGKIGYVTLNAEDVGAQPTIEDLNAIRSGAAEGATAVQPDEMTAALATKQDVIEDLSEIRSGAAAGATAVQPATLQEGLATKQNVIEDLSTIRSGAAAGATAVQPAALTPIESALQTIEDVIPSAASSQNQLADKNFVNSSISTNTANFVGTYNSLAELQAVQNPTNNDYGFVIETDAQGNEYYDRYKYVASSQQWLFEYKVESTPFTAAQWAAIQSGITSALVTKLNALPTNAELQQTLDGKADAADIPTALSQLSQDSTHRVVTDAEKSTWNGKQNAISDLDTIRSGAAAGATAVQPAALQEGLAGKQDTISDLATIRSGAEDGATAVQPDEMTAALAGKQNVIEDLSTIRSGAAAGATAVQPAAMNTALAAKQDTLTFDNTPTANSDNPVKSGGIKTALDAKQSTISTVNVTVDNNTGTPSGTASVSGSTLSLSFQNLKGATGATGATGPQGPQGERGLPGESGVTGDVSGFTVIQTIDPSATYGATDIAGAATVQATNAELTELAGAVDTEPVYGSKNGIASGWVADKVGEGVNSSEEESRLILFDHHGEHVNSDGTTLSTNQYAASILLYDITGAKRVSMSQGSQVYDNLYILDASHNKLVSKTKQNTTFEVDLTQYPDAKYMSASKSSGSYRGVWLYYSKSNISSFVADHEERLGVLDDIILADDKEVVSYDESEITNGFLEGGTFKSHSSCRLTGFIEVIGGETIYITGVDVNNGWNFSPVTCYGEEQNYLYPIVVGTKTSYSNKAVVIPYNCKYIRVCRANSTNPLIKRAIKVDNISQFAEKIDANKESIEGLVPYTFYPKDIPFTIETEGYRFLNTSLSANANYCITNYIEVIPGKKLHICTGFSTSSSYRTGVWYNADKTAITYIDGSTVAWNTREIEVPANAKYLRLCTNNRYGLRLYYITEPTVAEEIIEDKYQKIPLTINNGYYTSSGGVASRGDSRYKRTEFNIVQGEKFKIKMYNWAYYGGVTFFVLYNEDEGTYTSSSSSDSSVEYFTAPFNGKVMLSGSNGNNTPRTSFEVWKYGSSSSSSNKAFNKTIHTVGHSFWNGDGLSYTQFGQTKTRKGYQSFFKQVYEFNSFNDLKYDGHSLGAQSASDTSSIALKLSSWTGTAGDIWCMDSITNDFKRNIPLGTLADNYNAAEPDALTYYGALRLFRNKVVEVSGSEVVVVVSNATHRNQGGYTSTSTNTAGCTLSDYSHALMCVAEIEGWYFVDVFNYGGITDDNLSYTTIDGLHPNNLGYKLSVKPWIEQLNIIKEMYGYRE